MRYTDEQIDAIFDALYPMVEANPNMTQDQYQRHVHALARAALEAVQPVTYQSRYGGRDPGEDYDFAAGHFEVPDDVFEAVQPAEPLEDVLKEYAVSWCEWDDRRSIWSASVEPLQRWRGKASLHTIRRGGHGIGATVDEAIRNAVKAAQS